MRLCYHAVQLSWGVIASENWLDERNTCPHCRHSFWPKVEEEESDDEDRWTVEDTMDFVFTALSVTNEIVDQALQSRVLRERRLYRQLVRLGANLPRLRLATRGRTELLQNEEQAFLRELIRRRAFNVTYFRHEDRGVEGWSDEEMFHLLRMNRFVYQSLRLEHMPGWSLGGDGQYLGVNGGAVVGRGFGFQRMTRSDGNGGCMIKWMRAPLDMHGIFDLTGVVAVECRLQPGSSSRPVV